MNKIKYIANFVKYRYIYVIFLVCFFLGYYCPNILETGGLYLNLNQYLGVYEKIFEITLVWYGLSLYMKNPEKRMVCKIRLFFFIVLVVSVGYLYLLYSLQSLKVSSFDEIQRFILDIGLLKVHLGYMEIYTFLKIYGSLKESVFLMILFVLIFLSIIINFGKIIKHMIRNVLIIIGTLVCYLKKGRLK